MCVCPGQGTAVPSVGNYVGRLCAMTAKQTTFERSSLRWLCAYLTDKPRTGRPPGMCVQSDPEGSQEKKRVNQLGGGEGKDCDIWKEKKNGGKKMEGGWLRRSESRKKNKKKKGEAAAAAEEEEGGKVTTDNTTHKSHRRVC